MAQPPAQGVALNLPDAARLYAFVDAAYLHGRAPDQVARQLCDGGADLIQLRAKEWPVEDVHRVGERLLAITERAGVRLVINDHPCVAWELGAPLCHLGQEDFFDAGYTHADQLRAQLASVSMSGPRSTALAPGATLGLGLSSHAPDQAERAVAAGAAYVAVGPVYATGTKPTARPVTLEYVRWAAAHLTVPWFAIGGIDLGNLEAIMEAGARRVCVVSALLRATDLTRACQELKTRLLSAAV